MSVCSIPECGRKVVGRGWCSRHWQRWKNHGDPLARLNKPWDGKTCTGCGAIIEGISVTSRLCRVCMAKKTKAYRKANLEKVRAKGREEARLRLVRLRDEVFAKYGARCACCGEERKIFLVVDHVFGGGCAHRRSLSKTGDMAGTGTFLRDVIRRGYSSEFQVLCHNCNYAKAHGGCPHGGHTAAGDTPEWAR